MGEVGGRGRGSIERGRRTSSLGSEAIAIHAATSFVLQYLAFRSMPMLNEDISQLEDGVNYSGRHGQSKLSAKAR